MRWPKSKRFLKRLHSPLHQAERDAVEGFLGVARAFLALLSFVAVLVDAPDPPGYARLAHVLLIFWVLYSLGVVVWLRYRSVGPRAILGLHGLDVLWPLLITLFTEGPNSPFVTYFVFALVAAGFRWGFYECVATALAGVGLLNLEALLLSDGPPALQQLALEGQFDVKHLIIRCSYLIALGFMIGYLAENEKERRAESALINRVLLSVQANAGLSGSMQATLTAFIHVYGASHACVLMKNLSSNRLYLWQTPNGTAQTPRPFVREIPAEEAAAYELQGEPRTFFYTAGKYGPELIALAGDVVTREPGRRLQPLPCWTQQPTSVVSTFHELGNDWSCRILLLNAQLGYGITRELRFAEKLLRRTGPAIYSIYLIRRLRSHIGAIERARVARELHDGAIQSLISVEMQVDVLRRQAERSAIPMAGELDRIQQLLQLEVLNMRELMQHMKPVDMGPQQLLDFLFDTVDRFRRDTGISATFSSDLQEVEISPHACRELARILQEALVNIRKHAGARNVMVRLALENGGWKLIIDDDGCGFQFAGRLSFEELNTQRTGPSIIKERVRNIGAELWIESTPGRGARLEIFLPHKGQAFHG
ncbi:MAG TPA: histidine kinase [Clostridia bacterium]|nr:histidine kinase [Clostridia bacterium]